MSTDPVISESQLVGFLRRYQDRELGAPGLRGRIAAMIPGSMRFKVRVAITAMMAPLERRKAARLMAEADKVQLHLGCGEFLHDGFINVDLFGYPVDLVWDLTKPLPFPDNSVDVIFHEHVIEHMPGYRGYELTKECARVLKKGGVLRIAAPDSSIYMASYFDENHDFLNEHRDMQFTPMMELQYAFYSFGHQAVYDYETLELFCRVAGFSETEKLPYGESRISPSPDCDWRAWESLYLEAIK